MTDNMVELKTQMKSQVQLQVGLTKRYAWRVLCFVPLVSSIFFCDSPSFDDIEKALQLLALINTLMLGCVAGSSAPLPAHNAPAARLRR